MQPLEDGREAECPRCRQVFTTRPCGNPRKRLYAALLRHFGRVHPGMDARQRAIAAEEALDRANLIFVAR